MNALLRYFPLVLCLLLPAIVQATPDDPDRTLTLGIFTYSSDQQVYNCSDPTITELNKRLHDFKLQVRPINLHNVDNALISKELDFIITNPAHFIQLKEHYNLEGAIASLIRKAALGTPIRHTGGVIFTLNSRTDINKLTDIKGKWIAVAGTNHLGGYEAPAYELLQAGIHLPQQAHLLEIGDFQNVVDAVISDSVDVGFVPIGILEKMQRDGHLDMAQIKIINPRNQPGFPFKLSTKLYPQWPIIAMPHVQQKDIDALLQALLSISAKAKANADNSGTIDDFSPPADYRSVEAIMRALKIPPFDRPANITLADIWRQHYVSVTLSILAIWIILLLLYMLLVRNQQLRGQQKQAEQSATELQQIIDATQAGTWKWDLTTSVVEINERWAEMLGYAKQELLPLNAPKVARLTHRKDLAESKRLLLKHFRGESEYIDANFRMRHKDGHWVWIHSRGRVTQWTSNGTPQRVFGTHTDITERMEAELELQHSRAKYQRLIDNIGEKFIIYSHSGIDGIMTYVSEGVYHIFGRSKQQVEGKPWAELADWLPEDMEKARRYLELRAKGEADFVQFEMRFRLFDETLHTIRVSSHAVRDEHGELISIDGLAEDITHQKKAQERELMAATVFAHSQEAIIITDTHADIIDCNPATTELTGYAHKELIGQNPHIFASGTHKRPFYRQMWKTLLAGKVWQGSFCNRHKNGMIYWTESSISPIKDDTGRTTHYVSVSRDITQKKQQLQNLRQAKLEAQAANAAKSVFVANISHEIRTPMNAILGFTNLCLESSNLPRKPRKYLTNVKTSALAMLSLINEILDFSKIEAGKLHLESIPFDLNAELEQIISLGQQLVKDKPVKLKLRDECHLNTRLQGDPLRLKQVLTNLISNAAKFTSRGQVSLSVSECVTTQDSAAMEFSVCDTGIGMSQDELHSIFRPFSQADSSTTRKFGGTGLGLTISSELIKKMGGRIRVESEPGIGSTFYFRLSFPISEEYANIESSGNKIMRSYQHLSGTRVLLVEDNEINRELASEMLRKHHLKVDVAENGKVALDRLRENRYDVVLMDIQMPIMDGYQAARAIRKELRLRTLPIIALTANAASSIREKCMSAGMDDYLSKPIDMYKLMEKIDSTLNPVLQKVAGNQQYSPFSSTETSTQMEFPELINSEEALQRLGLDEQTLHELLQKFAAQHHSDAQQLDQFAKDEQWVEASRLAHTLKGLSATLGIDVLSQQAAELEQRCKALAGLETSDQFPLHDNDPQVVAQVLTQMKATLEETVRQINSTTQPAATKPLPPPPSNPNLKKELEDLLQLVEQYDVAAVEKAKDLLGLSFEDQIRTELQSIYDDLENFDFDSTSSTLKKLLSEL